MPGSSYAGQEQLLGDVFGATAVTVEADAVTLDGRRLPVVDGVIVALAPERLPPSVLARLGAVTTVADAGGPFAEDIQAGFGAEWASHPDILPEHEAEFAAYFDLVDLDGLAGCRVADLGCGIGRWSHFLAP